ncbi:type VI protein secretion system component VasF, partial [Pseudomonas sp. BIGb0450]|nr:type VI protein secretion system component VasF [Pseudomonas sp. BIGb0558]MCS3438317.1 type VI protein secretion system component VasF [Pseudomonas sp. BIGb0450]
MNEATPTDTTPPADNNELLGYLQQATGSKEPDSAEEQTKPKPPVLLADPEFVMRGVAWNPLCDAATPLIGLV